MIETVYPIWARYPEDREDYHLTFQVTSIGIWVIITTNEKPTHFLMVQQADQVGKPWGIPAGRVEEYELLPDETAIREIKEETGLIVDRSNIYYLWFNPSKTDHSKGQFIYRTHVSIDNFDLSAAQVLDNGTTLFNPPFNVDRSEIEQHALIPIQAAFHNNIPNGTLYHPDSIYRGYVSLRSMGLMPQAMFDFESDPWRTIYVPADFCWK